MPKKPWDDIFQARSYGKKCHGKHDDNVYDNGTVTFPTSMSEDCLNLNVYVPAGLDSNKKYPVLGS